MQLHLTKKSLRKTASIITILSLFVALFGPPFQTTSAATLTDMSDTMSRLGNSSGGDVLSDHSIQFTTPTGVASTETIVVTFPSDFDGENDGDGALDESDVDLFEDTTPDGICDGTAETLVAATPGTDEWTAVFSGTENRVLTLTSGGASATIAADSEVCIEIGENATGGSGNSQYANPSTSGSKTISLSVGSGADTGDILVEIIDDDQVSVSADVSATISFSISDNSIGFGTLSSSAARWATGDTNGSGSDTSAHNLVAGTNSSSGYSITINGATLTSGANTIDAIGGTSAASSTGSEQFGLYIAESGGSGTASAPYNDDSTPEYALDTGAFPDEVASSSGASADTTYAVHYIANISSSTEAGSYSATLTYVATGNF